MTGGVVVVGSVNADLVVEMERLPAPGETVLARTGHGATGGKGANQAIAAARAGGAETTFVGAVGDDVDGESARAELSRSGVTPLLRVVPGSSTGLALVMVEDSGENAIVLVGGANAVPPVLDKRQLAAIREADVLLCQLETPLALLETAARESSSTALLVLNAAPAMRLDARQLKLVDVLVVNEHELRAQSAASSLEAALAEIEVPVAVVTLGARGVAFRARDGKVSRVSPHLVNAVDTTGAGDTFCGALAARLAMAVPIDAAVAFANAAAALAVTRRGASSAVPPEVEVHALLEGVAS